MKRPNVTDFFDKDEYGHAQSLDVDFAEYLSQLEKYVDHLESEINDAENTIRELYENDY